MDDLLTVLVPAAAEVLLLGLCLRVAVRLRRLEVGGVYQLTLAGIAVDGLSQGWQLGLRLGRPAGLAWLLHVALCYMMLYLLLRLGDLLARMRQRPAETGLMGQGVFGQAELAREGGRTG